MVEYESKKMESGLTVMHCYDRVQARNSGLVLLIVKVGFRDEDKSESEFSHFLDHVLFQCGQHLGHPSFTKNYGKNLHFATLSDHTVFGYSVTSDEEMSVAFNLLSYMATKAEITKEDLKKQRDAISIEDLYNVEKSEIKFGSKMESHIYNQLDIEKDPSMCEIFLQNVKSITVEEIDSYYKKWYRLSNMALISVGNYKFKDLLAKVRLFFDTVDKENVNVLSRRRREPHNKLNIKAMNIKDFTRGAVLILQHERRKIKEANDLRRIWDSECVMRIYNMMMERNAFCAADQSVYVYGKYLDQGFDHVYSFTAQLTDKHSSPTFLLLTLFQEVRRFKQRAFHDKFVCEVREDLVQDLESRLRLYRNNKQERLMMLADKLKMNYLYGDVVMHPALERDIARDWFRAETFGRVQ